MNSATLPTETTVCIAGCGPAGAMLGLLLARAGVDGVVLEKHADFFRDFRGDTIHASTLQVLAGDVAHAMSPIAGVGINLAIQDAVAASNLLVGPLLRGCLTERDLARVQRRRSLPTRLTQRVQLLVQKQMVSLLGAADRDGPVTTPRPLRVLSRVAPLRGLFSRFMAIGFRNEHVRTVPARQGVAT